MFIKYVLGLIAVGVILNCSTNDLPKEVNNMHEFDKLWNYGDPAATEQKFREILDETDESKSLEFILELKTQIARTLGLQQEFVEAHTLLDEVEHDLKPDADIARIRYLLERGRVLNSSGKPEDSKALFLKAWALGKQHGADFYAVDAAHMLGIVEEPAQQLIWNEKAMALAEISMDQRANGWLGPLYNNIGWTYHDLGKFEKALEIFEKSLAWRESKQQIKETQIAKWCVARAHRSLGNIDLALELQLALEKEIKVSGNPEDGYVAEEIAECLTMKGETEQAAPYFMSAWKLLSEDIWLKQNEAGRLERLKTLGAKTK